MTPDYYKLPNGGEVLDLFTPEERRIFLKVSAVKYLFRAGNKPENPAERDYNKAVNCVKKIIDTLKQKEKQKEASTYEVLVDYTDGGQEKITLRAESDFDALAQVWQAAGQDRRVKSISNAKHVK